MPEEEKKKYLGLRLGEILVLIDKIGSEELESLLIAHKNTPLRLGEFLLQRGIITEDDLLEALSLQLDVEYHRDLLKDSGAVLSSNLPHGFIRKNNIVILRETDDLVEIALNDTSQLGAIENIKTMTGKDVKPVLAKKLDILRIADILAGEEYESADKVIDDLKQDGENIQILGENEQTEQDVLDLANEAPIIKLVNLMITEALKERASDIHIEPSEEGITVRYRIDGILYNALSPPKRYQQAIVSRVKIMANMNIAENRLPQDGRIKVKYGTSDVDIRVSTVPSVVGERVVMRLLVKDDRRFDLTKLGMNEDFLKSFRDMLHIPHGIIIVSGPTGSGKTTSLYAAIREINTPDKNIITIEDPVEYRIKGISQIQVNPKINLTFAVGLRSILRQDPEIIMVGEIRDHETAEIAIQAAMTGHLVFSTVHTNDASSAVVRLLDIGVEPYLIASTVTGFLSQRLVRVLCPECKESYRLDPEILRQEGIDPVLFRKKTVFKPKGCPKCNSTGFFDRIGIYEMIRLNERVRKLIVERRDASYIRKRCNEMGMRTLIQDGIDKILMGITSIDEVLRVIRE
ncbi:MAG TPA: type II secretion system ATPase GspE [Spirochaetota bacterium]|nr:type II secretion system ATPase GspE [Spirochaetota bacterium]